MNKFESLESSESDPATSIANATRSSIRRVSDELIFRPLDAVGDAAFVGTKLVVSGTRNLVAKPIQGVIEGFYDTPA